MMEVAINLGLVLALSVGLCVLRWGFRRTLAE
jgi:hypothetical protein